MLIMVFKRKPGSGRYKAWKEKVGAKLKFCISENRLDQCLNRLKNYNGVFGRLSAQTKELNNCQKVAIFPPSLLRSDQRLKQRTLVRDAATQLYNALVDACASHPEHLAHFRLEPHYGIESSPKCIRFDVAFAQNLLEGPSHNTDPVWFAIESMFNENLKNEPDVPPEKAKEAWSNFKSTLKRAISQDFSPSIATKKPKRKKTVSFACPPSKVKTSAKIAPPIPLPQISMTTFPDSSLPNFCVGQDFCSHVQRCSKRPSDSFDTCIGYLQRTETCSHRVYHKHPEQNFETNPVFTLAQIFTSISGLDKSQRRSKRMLQCESLRLARQLASAVLQFHATPILKESWRSDDIVFFGKSRTAVLRTQNPDMKTPHLNVRVRNTPGQLANPSTINSILNTNPYTFGLGIILLEIAYQAPFRQLRLLESNSLLPSDVTQESTSAPELSSLSSSPASSDFVINPSSSTALDDFAVATNLSQSLSAEMGVPYARIVRKCINCDFGQGTRDLRDEGLQEAFHNDVVLELEILERAFAGLQLSDGTGERLVGIMR